MTERAAARAAAAETRLPPAGVQRLLIALCAAGLVFVAVHYVIAFAAVPRYIQRVTDGEVPASVVGGEADVSNELMAEEAAKRGLSLRGYALYSLALSFGIAAAFCAAAGLVLWKHGGDWVRWLAALLLFFFPTGSLFSVAIIAFREAEVFRGASFMLWAPLLWFLFLFPNGGAPAKWMRWPAAAASGLFERRVRQSAEEAQP